MIKITECWTPQSSHRDTFFSIYLVGASSDKRSRPEKAFITAGFTDWKHATGQKGILNCHDKCRNHKEAVIAWN